MDKNIKQITSKAKMTTMFSVRNIMIPMTLALAIAGCKGYASYTPPNSADYRHQGLECSVSDDNKDGMADHIYGAGSYPLNYVIFSVDDKPEYIEFNQHEMSDSTEYWANQYLKASTRLGYWIRHDLKR